LHAFVKLPTKEGIGHFKRQILIDTLPLSYLQVLSDLFSCVAGRVTSKLDLFEVRPLNDVEEALEGARLSREVVTGGIFDMIGNLLHTEGSTTHSLLN